MQLVKRCFLPVSDGAPGRRTDKAEYRTHAADDADLERAQSDLLQEDDRVRDTDAQCADEREVEEFDGDQMSLTVTQVQPPSQSSTTVLCVGGCSGDGGGWRRRARGVVLRQDGRRRGRADDARGRRVSDLEHCDVAQLHR